MKPHYCVLQNLLLLLSIYGHSFISASPSPPKSLLLPNDPSALLEFKSRADLRNKLGFSPRTGFRFCQWDGVQCSNSRAVKVVIESLNLGGVFAPNTLTQLDQLRVLSLQNNSLTGRIPDLSGLFNLKVLFLSRNCFSGIIPPSVSSLHRLKTLDLSYNMLSGLIPHSLNHLDRLYYLRLDFNRFNGSVPPFNQSTLQIFNVSHNLLSGAIPLTQTLSHFETSSFGLNYGLCGEIIRKECHSIQPFFAPQTPAAAPPTPEAALSQTAQLQGGAALGNGKGLVQRHKTAALVIGFSSAASLFALSLLCLAFASGKCRSSSGGEMTKMGLEVSVTGNAEAVMRIQEENDELEEKVKRMQEEKQAQVTGNSESLVFCADEQQAYSLDQLMRASAELLGRGTMGTTYKAVLDSRLTVTVKRLDGGMLPGVSQEAFEGHLESVGGLRHPNLVPVRAYFQAREERLLVYDYSRNGSLFSLIHGSKSARAKPLHWTSSLKIAEDVAQGLSYIHQAWRLVHGNLKSSNVLLGSDFEACLTDYCLVSLATHSSDEEEDANSIACRAPEIRKSNRGEATSKCDVYSFGVLLLELLTGKHPSEHPNLAADEMLNWMRSVRDHDSGENRSEMLLRVVMACNVASPERRPTMWQVLKMIQEIKEVVLTEGIEFRRNSGT